MACRAEQPSTFRQNDARITAVHTNGTTVVHNSACTTAGINGTHRNSNAAAINQIDHGRCARNSSAIALLRSTRGFGGRQHNSKPFTS